jgi:hypothetical protein
MALLEGRIETACRALATVPAGASETA